MTPTERFLSKIEIDGHCHMWTGSVRTDGYGQFKVDGYNWAAHRYSWTHFNKRPILEGVLVRHTCDRPLCVNPDHLILGTPADNSRDMVERGRSLTGSRNHRANLTEEQALAIYSDPRAYPEICAEYGVWKGTVSAIKTGRSWSKETGHVKG